MIGRERAGFDPLGQTGDGLARGGEGGLVAELGQDRIRGGSYEQDGEDAVFVEEDDGLVAVEISLPGDRAH